MNIGLLAKRGARFHVLSLAVFGLAILSLGLLIVGTNCKWWGILDVKETSTLIGPFGLKDEEVCLFIHLIK